MSGEREDRRATAERVTRRLAEAVEVALGDRLVVEKGTKPDYFGEGVVLDAFAIVERCPRRVANPAGDFVESVFTARRRVGLFVLRELAGQTLRTGEPASSGLAATADRVVTEQLDWPDRLRDWVGGLDRAGRTALVGAVTTWCDGALRLVGRDPRIRWADPARPPAWNVPGRIVQLRGPVDAVIGTVGRGEKLLGLSDAAPGPADRLRAGHLALVRTLTSQHAPVRISTASAATGALGAVPVDEPLLDLVADRVVEVLTHRADPDAAAPWPGRGCSHCHLLEQCDEGLAYVASRRRALPAPEPG